METGGGGKSAGRALGDARQVVGIQNGAVDDDGKRMMFELVTKDGTPHAFHVGLEAVGKMVNFLLVTAQFAAEQSGGLKKPREGASFSTKVISAIAFGVAPGRTDREVILAVHLGIEEPMGFAVTPNDLAGLRDLLNRVLVATPGAKAN